MELDGSKILKGMLVNSRTKEMLEFQYNPPEINHSSSSNWAEITVPGLGGPLYQFVAGGPEEIPLEEIPDDDTPLEEELLLDDEPLRSRMGRTAGQRSARFGQEKTFEQYWDAHYEAILTDPALAHPTQAPAEARPFADRPMEATV